MIFFNKGCDNSREIAPAIDHEKPEQDKAVTMGMPICIGIPDWLFDNIPQLRDLKERVIFNKIVIRFEKYATRVETEYYPVDESADSVPHKPLPIRWNKISLNDKVRFKLTQKGFDYAKAHNVTYLKGIGEWSEMQLWDFSALFGSEMMIGLGDQCVELNMEIEKT